ncbi:MAG: hypothetical protein COA62_16595 [Rhodobiaceae bacterium]|nr:MAG: hypothetical protein COA62_16595 [Rhodobiaceae bacterium]
MKDGLLRADCASCAALCCVGLAFDQSDFFAYDKPAGVACRNLGSNGRCGIHPQLEERGFAGCVWFDCLGAGQRVTQELFEGRSWRDHPELGRSMFDAFRAMRLVHEFLSLLQTAGQLPLTSQQAEKRDALLRVLDPPQGWSTQTLIAFEQSDTPTAVREFLTTLRGHLGAERQSAENR